MSLFDFMKHVKHALRKNENRQEYTVVVKEITGISYKVKAIEFDDLTETAYITVEEPS